MTRLDSMRLDALRVAPHSIDAEQAVLGGLMLDERAFERIADRLSENDFYRKDHRLIFRAVSELSAKNQPVDAVTMGEWFEANGLADLVGGSSYILQLASTTPGAANILGHARIVREKAMLRGLIDAGTEITGYGFEPDGKTVQEILDTTIARLMDMQRVEVRAESSVKQAAKKAYDSACAAHSGTVNAIPTGLDDLDNILGGLHNGDLIVIGARPSMGKTALMVGMAKYGAGKGNPVGIISAEQPAEQLAARMMALSGRIAAKTFRTGAFEEEEWPRVAGALTAIGNLPIWILDRSAPHIAEVQRVARRWKKQHGIKALFCDYLQRMEGPGERRNEQVGAIARGLKNLARDLEIPVVALGQVNRDVEKRKVPEPRMGDLSDSSEIEKEADQIFLLYRDEYYNPESSKRGVAKIIIDKNRHGETGYVEVTFEAKTMCFTNLAHHE